MEALQVQAHMYLSGVLKGVYTIFMSSPSGVFSFDELVQNVSRHFRPRRVNIRMSYKGPFGMTDLWSQLEMNRAVEQRNGGPVVVYVYATDFDSPHDAPQSQVLEGAMALQHMRRCSS
ncbi:hypothetical protein NQD34_002950 [Periophthalmus magnuspinnatus]|nr:hypothetical protein NQD34_002950 [Periophthalmus magnuspinnatus]